MVIKDKVRVCVYSIAGLAAVIMVYVIIISINASNIERRALWSKIKELSESDITKISISYYDTRYKKRLLVILDGKEDIEHFRSFLRDVEDISFRGKVKDLITCDMIFMLSDGQKIGYGADITDQNNLYLYGYNNDQNSVRLKNAGKWLIKQIRHYQAE